MASSAMFCWACSVELVTVVVCEPLGLNAPPTEAPRAMPIVWLVPCNWSTVTWAPDHPYASTMCSASSGWYIDVAIQPGEQPVAGTVPIGTASPPPAGLPLSSSIREAGAPLSTTLGALPRSTLSVGASVLVPAALHGSAVVLTPRVGLTDQSAVCPP